MTNMMCSVFSLLVIFSAATVHSTTIVDRSTFVERDDCTRSTSLNSAQQQAVLDAHNKWRGEAGNGDAANELKVEWDDALASRAQDWAEQCEWRHSLTTECNSKKSVGQNLAASSVSGTPDVAGLVKLWAEEKQFYTYNSGACSDVCSHYTQVAWANTARVGCGMKYCSRIGKLSDIWGSGGWVLACDYSPPGNYYDEKPYLQGPPCSKCQSVIESGAYRCEDNLCVPN